MMSICIFVLLAEKNSKDAKEIEIGSAVDHVIIFL
jgi:hypothetical protein